MKKKLLVLVLSGVSLSLVPFVASATFCQSSSIPGTLQNILCRVGDFLNAVVPVLVILAVLYFIWGVIKYVVSGDEEDKAKGRSMIIYGIIGIAVIIGVWGLANLLLNSLGIDKPTTVDLPTIQGR